MKWYLAAPPFILIILLACAKRHEKDAAASPVNKKEIPAKETVQPAPQIKYYFFAHDNSQNINKTFTDTQLNIILAINRVDFSKLHKVDTLVVPDTFLNDIKYYSPFPDSVPVLYGVRKALLFSYKIQAFGAYENGNLVRWGPTSMGKQSTPTPTGLFHTNWKAERTVSTDDSTWIMYWYFNLHNERGVSMHQYELPGYPASHACIRLYEKDAKWFYHWAEQWKLTADRIRIRAYGTPVVIFGTYDFNGIKPWYLLTANAEALHQNADSLSKEITPFLSTILQRQWVRDSIMQRPANSITGNLVTQ